MTVLEFLKVVSDPTVCLCLIYTILAKKVQLRLVMFIYIATFYFLYIL